MSNTFSRTDDFSTYPLIYEIASNAPSASYTVNVDTVTQGRYIVIHKIAENQYLDIQEIRVFGPDGCPKL